VLTHGAGGNSRSALLVAVSRAFAEAGFHVLRCDLPFRQARATGPPSPAGAARDRAGLEAAVHAMRGLGAGRVVLGGLSYGGRQATMLAAEVPEIAQSLLLFSYPLHPPGRSAEPRTAHLPRLRTPAVFVFGTRDPFGSPAEIRQAVSLIPAATALVEIEGAGHDLSRGRRAAAETHRDVAARALDALRGLAVSRR
jgi:predicted alpha/beta-hydrolase family hydrolase